MPISQSEQPEDEKPSTTESGPDVLAKNQMPFTPSQQRGYEAPRGITTNSGVAMMNEYPQKKILIRHIKGLWGKHFVSTYIPMCHRPHRDTRYWNKLEENHSHLYDANARYWPLSILKGILVLAELTSDEDWVRRTLAQVVDYRIRNTKYHILHITGFDCEIARDMLVYKWDVGYAFQKNPLFSHTERDQSNDKYERIFDVNRDLDHDSGIIPRNEEVESDTKNEQGHGSGSNVEQRGIAAASSKAQPEDRRAQQPSSETSSFCLGERQKKRKRSTVDDELLEAITVPFDCEDFSRDHASEHGHAKHPSHNTCTSSSSSSLSHPSSLQSSKMNRSNMNISRYGMFPPPPSPRPTTPPAQNTSETRRHENDTQAESKRIPIDLTTSPPGHRKYGPNTRFENNKHIINDDENEDHGDDEVAIDILKAKIAVLEAEIDLIRLRMGFRTAKKAKASVAGRGNSTFSS